MYLMNGYSVVKDQFITKGKSFFVWKPIQAFEKCPFTLCEIEGLLRGCFQKFIRNFLIFRFAARIDSLTLF